MQNVTLCEIRESLAADRLFVSPVVMLNALIAMMSDAYTRVEMNNPGALPCQLPNDLWVTSPGMTRRLRMTVTVAVVEMINALIAMMSNT